MSVSSGSDITIPIQDSPPPPPSPYAGTNGGGKGNEVSAGNKSPVVGVGGPVTIIDTSSAADGDDDATGGKSTPEPRGDVTVTVGFVNEAYQDHSPDHHNHHPEKNGHSKMTNGQKKNSNGAISIAVPGEGNEKGERQEIHLNEAVNPELINMNILNTIPDKPNPEYGPYDNLDEYFVPVNQHKKFLRRSEKLYVTKDKRKETHWKKYVCWVLGASIVAAIVTVAVLAGIGYIPHKSPNHFDSVVGTTSATESASSSGDLYPGDIIVSSSPESSLPSSTEINTPPSVPVDATYVPMAADIHFHITDLQYESALYDKTSDKFHQLATEVQDEVKDILRRRAGLRTVYSRVNEFAPGSVFVKMRIGWLDQAMNFDKVTMLLSNVTSVGKHDIMPMRTYEVVNLCKFNNKNGCSHNCTYDYIQMEFVCSCGSDDSLYLAEDKKTCLSMYDITSSTTSEIPLLPEFSSYSPSPVSEEDISSPAPPPSSSSEEPLVHHEFSEKAQTEVPEQYQTEPATQEEEEHTHEHHEHHQMETSSEEPSPPLDTSSVSHEQPEQPETSSEEPSPPLDTSSVSHEQPEPETSTEADLPSDTLEPVSHEHHHDDAEIIPISISSTTSTTTTTTMQIPGVVEPVSEEVIEPEHHHEEEHQPIIVPVETTTPAATTTSTTSTTPEPLPILIASSEETQQHHHDEDEETSSHGVVPASSTEEHESTEQPTVSQDHHLPTGSLSSSSSSSEELGRSDLDETVHPTEPAPGLSEEVVPQAVTPETLVPETVPEAVAPEESHESTPSDNATVVENVRDVSSEYQEEEHHVPIVVPTELPQSQPEEIEETTVIPPVVPTHEEVPSPVVEEEKKSVDEEHVHAEQVPAVPVPATTDEEEATTAVSDDDTEVPTTVVPEAAEEPESEHLESHDITPMDVLSFSSSTQGSTSTTPASPVEEPIHTGEVEQSQGRSVSSSSSSAEPEISDEVESISSGAVVSTDQASLRSQNLSEDDTESATEVSGNREARLLSTEIGDGNTLQLLAEDGEKSGEPEEPVVPVEIPQVEQQELPRASQNVTESASVETADENPETASAVTKTSEDVTSQDGASREAATVPMTERESSQSQSGSNENNNGSENIFGSSSTSDSESSEVSQESPVVVPQSDSESGERTTFAPLSLHHDIDINYLGNNTEDHQNSEPVEPHVVPEVETVQGENVSSQEAGKVSDKLVTAPEDDQVEVTTTAPSLVEREDLVSQEEIPQPPAASGESRSDSADNTEQVSTSGESGESQDEPTGTTTRGITSSSELFNTEDAFESPNRDHRDTNADIETPFVSLKESSQEQEIVTTEVPVVISSSTTTTTTTTTEAPTTTTATTTTTTTIAPPPLEPEVALAEVITTTTTTTTSPAPETVATVASTNDTQSSSILSDSNSSSDSFSHESSNSGSQEESSSSHLNSHEGFPSSSSPEEKSSVSEPTVPAVSYEVGQSSSPSLDSHDSSSSSTDEDLHHNELT